jgi:hypothetical protein
MACTLRSLPQDKEEEAARSAQEIFPANAPLQTGSARAVAAQLPPQRIALLTSRYWGAQPRSLSVRFLDRSTRSLRSRVVRHMNAWYTGTAAGGSRTCVRFVQAQGTDPGQVRITTSLQDGYWSYLGTDIRHIPSGEPTMCLEGFTADTEESEYRRVVRHETGHTLGFPHEHMRRALVQLLDPEKAYAYFTRTQGWDRATVDAQVLTSLEDRQILVSADLPDQNSIMCYQLPGAITRSGAPISGGVDIDPQDAAFAHKIYPRR